MKRPGWSRVSSIAVVGALGLGLVVTLVWFVPSASPPPAVLPFSAFVRNVEETPQAFKRGTLLLSSDSGPAVTITGQWREDGKTFVTTGYLDERLLERLRRSDLPFEVAAVPGLSWTHLLAAAVPLVVLVLLWLLLRRRLSGGGMAMSFRESRARRAGPEQRRVTFADLAGLDEVREELQELVLFLTDPTRFTRLGGRIPKGILLMGQPGTGKTLLARALAGEAQVPFFTISGSDFVEMFVGVGASRVRALFEEAKASAPCIIFIDEIDAVGRQRGTGLGGGHDEREQTLNQLLVEMDGFAPNEGVILIAATNRPDILDPALLRPGRFDRQMVVPHPDVVGRTNILRVHTRKTPLHADVDLAVIARGTPGFVGADLSSLVNEAALLAARGNKDRLDMHDLEMARDKVLMGPERRSLVVSQHERRVTAYHEAGHAMMGKLTKGSAPVHKVTIVPRGSALGLTQLLPVQDRLSLSSEDAHAQIAFAMGGRVAEELVFGQVTTGAANDLKIATDLARRMVREWGMSAHFGPVTLGHRPGAPPFVGRSAAESRGYSARTAAEVDDEVRRIVLESHEQARRLVAENLPTLKRVAEALLLHETLDGADVDLLLADRPLSRPAPAR